MKINKIIAGIMAVCVMGCGVPYVNTVTYNTAITASAEGEAEYTEDIYEHLVYRNYGDYIEISYCCLLNVPEIIIPSEIEGLPVTTIGDRAFENHKDLKSIEIPKSVTSIGKGAFEDCRSLKSIEIPKSVTSIGEGAFRKCTGLKSINIPNSITSIEDLAFSDCISLTSINIPNSVTSIGSSAFYDCSNLTSINIPESVTSIGESAFEDCSSLTSINIPESVTSIGRYAFYNTPWFKEKQKENPLVIVNEILIDGTACQGDVVIPDGVTSIGDSAFYSIFYSCYLTSIEIADSVTSIGQGAFNDCSSLEEITILNPECDIFDDDSTISNSVFPRWDYNEYYFDGTIYGYDNSTAQAYAEKYGRKFESLGKAPENETSTGDMNGDNSVNISDAVILQNCILGKQELTEEQFKNADMTGDGVVDSFDLVLLKRKVIYGK